MDTVSQVTDIPFLPLRCVLHYCIIQVTSLETSHQILLPNYIYWVVFYKMEYHDYISYLVSECFVLLFVVSDGPLCFVSLDIR